MNVGKTAFNATNGVEIGKIVSVGYTKVNAPREIVVYFIRAHGKERESPADNVDARTVSPTVPEN